MRVQVAPWSPFRVKHMKNEYLDKARNWFESAKNKHMFGDVKGAAITAVAEYLANLDGKSNWDVKPVVKEQMEPLAKLATTLER